MVPALHILTDDEIVARPDFLARAAALMHVVGPNGALHLRARTLGGRAMYDLATALRPIAATTGAMLVINDRLDVALAASIDAVQLTARSLTVAEARAIHPAWRIGLSIHAPVSTTGADWLVAGHVFDTPSHATEPPRGLAWVTAVCAATTAPVIAIGGIRPADVAALRAAGAHGVAVIGGIWDATDVERAAADYLTAISRGSDV